MSPVDTTASRISELEAQVRTADAKFNELRGFL